MREKTKVDSEISNISVYAFKYMSFFFFSMAQNVFHHNLTYLQVKKKINQLRSTNITFYEFKGWGGGIFSANVREFKFESLTTDKLQLSFILDFYQKKKIK